MPDGIDVSDILNEKGLTLREYQIYNPNYPFGVPLTETSTETDDVVESDDIWNYEVSEAGESYQEETKDEDIYKEEHNEQETDKETEIDEMEKSEIQAKVEDEAVEDEKNTQKDRGHVEVEFGYSRK